VELNHWWRNDRKVKQGVKLSILNSVLFFRIMVGGKQKERAILTNTIWKKKSTEDCQKTIDPG